MRRNRSQTAQRRSHHALAGTRVAKDAAGNTATQTLPVVQPALASLPLTIASLTPEAGAGEVGTGEQTGGRVVVEVDQPGAEGRAKQNLVPRIRILKVTRRGA